MLFWLVLLGYPGKGMLLIAKLFHESYPYWLKLGR